MQNNVFSSSIIRNRYLAALITICFSIPLLNACSATADRADKLEQTLRGYEKALRWSKFDMAYSFIKWESAEPPALPEHLDSIRLTHYGIESRNLDESSMTATQIVKIQYYNQNDLREHVIKDKQIWKYFEKEERWLLISKPPSFK